MTVAPRIAVKPRHGPTVNTVRARTLQRFGEANEVLENQRERVQLVAQLRTLPSGFCDDPRDVDQDVCAPV